MQTESEGHNLSKSRPQLWIILCVLSFIIVALIITIIIVIGKNSTETTTPDNQEEPNMTVGEEFVKEYDDFNTLFDDTTAQAKRLIEKGNYNIEDVYKLYDDAINEYISEERFDYAWAFAKGEMKLLSEAGLRAEALQALIRVDYDKFPIPMQYESYTEIIKLAESIGDNAALEKYTGLAAETKEAAEAVQRATAEAASKFEAEIENAEEEPEE